MINKDIEINEQINNSTFVRCSQGVFESVKASIRLTIFFELIALFVFFFSQKLFFQPLFSFMMSTVFFSIIIGSITFFSSLFIGVPAVLVLKKLNVLSPLNTAIIGGISALVFLLVSNEGKFIWSFLIFVLYGINSGYAFMQGYKKAYKA